MTEKAVTPGMELQVVGDVRYLSSTSVKRMVNVIQEIMRDIMKRDTHYGTIPGTQKPTLYKAGAELLAFTFRLAPTYAVTQIEMPKSHFRYEVICTLTSLNGNLVSQGVGCCSSMESKYRWRMGGKVPAGTTKEQIAEMVAAGTAKWTKFGPKLKQENPDIEDVRNTVEKMASKRAFVDAVLKGTACSDIFTQDLEDTKKEEVQEAQEATQAEDTPPTTTTKAKPQAKATGSAGKATPRTDGYRKITAKRDQKCKVCEKDIAKDKDKIWWNPKEKGAMCDDCGSQTDVPFEAPAEAAA